MIDKFALHASKLSDPASDAFSVTPHDTNDLPSVSRGIYIGGDGNLSIITLAGTTVTFANLVAGTIVPIRAVQIRATGTTATNIVALV